MQDAKLILQWKHIKKMKVDKPTGQNVKVNHHIP